MEFQQGIWSKLYKHSIINLPDSATGWASDIIASAFPRATPSTTMWPPRWRCRLARESWATITWLSACSAGFRALIRNISSSIGINEYTLIADTTPDFQDWGPFLFYHNLFNSNQNVMAGFDFNWTPAESFSLYGQFILDDFMLSTESGKSLATAGAKLVLDAGTPAVTLNAGFTHQFAAGAGPAIKSAK